MRKRVLSALMAVCLMLTLLPVSVFAAGNEGQVTAHKEAEPNDDGTYTITLSVQGEPIPTTTESAADVVLVVDNSGSMASGVGEPCGTPNEEFEKHTFLGTGYYECPNCHAIYVSILGFASLPDICTGEIGGEARIITAQKVGKEFASSILSTGQNKMAVIGFSHGNNDGGANDQRAIKVSQGLTNDVDEINEAIDDMEANGGTNYSAALQQAYSWLDERSDADKENRPAYVVFISDGAPGYSGESVNDPDWNGSKQATALKADGVTVYTIGIALSDNDSQYLESLASEPTSEHYLNVTGTNYAEELEKILIEWADKINSIPAGKNAVMTDVINSEYFELVQGSLSDGLEIDIESDPTGNTLVWDIGNIPENGEVSFDIQVKEEVKDQIPVDGMEVPTNAGVDLTYTSNLPDGGSVEMDEDDIGNPEVTICGTKEEGTELGFDDLNYGVKEVVTSSYVALTDPDERFEDYTPAVEQDDGTYTASTTSNSITLLYQVRLSSETAGAITVRDEGAVYVGAKLGTGTTVADNGDGSYTVTFGESARWANLYFTVTVNDIPTGGTVPAGNTAVIGEKEVEGDDVTVYQGERYRVTYVWSVGDGPNGVDVPKDNNLYRPGDIVTVSDQYYVGQVKEYNTSWTYVFHGYTVGAPTTGVTIDEDNQFIMPNEDVTLVGHWQPYQTLPEDEYFITVKVVNGSAKIGANTVTNVASYSYEEGSNVTINFTPDSGYMLGTVMVDGKWVPEGLDDGNTYTFENIDADHGIVVYFVKDTNEYTLTYDGNANDPTMDGVPEEVTGQHYGDKVTVANGPTRDDYVFVNWNTQTDGKGTAYNSGDQITITGNTTLYAIWEAEESFTLTYDANGSDVTNMPTPNPETGLKAGTHNLSPTVPVREGYGFIGWSTTKDGTIYEAGQELPTVVTSVNMQKDTTVYAVWGADTNGDDVADATQVLIKPENITIYQGGTGYESVVGDETTGADKESTGLPEPGYSIVLPYTVNEELKKVAASEDVDDDIVNLTDYLTFNYEHGDVTRTWKIETYDRDGNSRLSDGRYIYRILPAEDAEGQKIPIRLLFTNEAGEEFTSDDFFGIDQQLYDTLQMTIYSGDLEQNLVTASVKGTEEAQDVGVGTGELVIRGTTDTAATVAVNDMENDADGFTVTAAEDNAYYVNGSPIQVQESDIRLLADDLAMEEDSETEKAMQDAADKAIDTALDNPQYEFKYLDLVDYNNGNAYVTLNQNSEGDVVTVNWPMPTNADPDTIHVVHFGELDREFEISGLEGLLGENVSEIAATVNEETGVVSFSTSTFSPFVLVYETKATEYHTVRFDSNGGSSVASQQVADGQTAREPSDPTRSNYRFEGWYLNGKLYDFDTPVTADITLEAHWDRIDDDRPTPDYAILRFESNGGTEFDDIERDEPFEYNPYDNIPTRSGYRFTGWYRDSSLRNRLDDEDLRVTWGITTVYAGWAETSVPSMLNGSDHYAYIQGYSDGTVRPEANITRAQVATIFFRLLDEDVRDDNLTTYNTFPDVNEDYWANTAISTMASLGVINGRNNGSFDPNAYITRAEFAAICARFDDSDVTGVSTFTDIASHWAKDEIERAAALGWVQGYADGTFRPNAYITRAQAVTMINRVLNRLPEDADDLLSGMNVWTDCQEGDWYYLAIQEATNSHDFETKNRVYETWTDLNSDPDWSRYEN